MSSAPTLDRSNGGSVRRGQNLLKAAGRSLTPDVLKSMLPGADLSDPDHPGLRVRRVGEQRTFYYRYRAANGALRQVEVGVLGPLRLTEIRARWQHLKDVVRNGGDPRAEAIAARKAAAAQQAEAKVKVLTVGDVIDAYLSEVVEVKRKAKGAAETRRMLEQLIKFKTWASERPTLGRRRASIPKDISDVADLPAVEFSRDKAHALLVAFGQSAPRVGGMARQELRAAWRYAIDAGRLPSPSPFERPAGGRADQFGGGKLVSASKRDRVLSKDEVGRLLRWMAEPGTYSRSVRDALEVVLRTGLRSGEVCGIHSSELSRRDGVLWLDIPASKMKAKRPHSVPLVGRAEEVLMARMPDKPGFLFPSARDGSKPIQQKALGVEVYACSGRSKAKAYATRKVCPVGDWGPHDLRRTARTLLAALGCPYEVGEAILAHALPGVAAVYNQHDYRAEKLTWLTALGEHLDDLQAANAKLSLISEAA